MEGLNSVGNSPSSPTINSIFFIVCLCLFSLSLEEHALSPSIAFSMYFPKGLNAAQGMYDDVPKDIYTSFLRNPIVALPRRVVTFLTVAVPFSICWLLLFYDHVPSFLSVGLARTTPHWHGWASVENLIVLYATDTYARQG